MFFLLDTMPFLYIGQLLRISTSCTYVSATFFFLEYELLNNCRIGLNCKRNASNLKLNFLNMELDALLVGKYVNMNI